MTIGSVNPGKFHSSETSWAMKEQAYENKNTGSNRLFPILFPVASR
jgi:hypothetical protein